MADRFYVRESTGYLSASVHSGAPPTTELLVLDADDCHHVVWSNLWSHPEASGRGGRVERRLDRDRRRASLFVRRLNAGDLHAAL